MQDTFECHGKEPPPIQLRFARTVKDLERARGREGDTTTTLLVFKDSWCERCPAFEEAVADLATKYTFDYYYADAADTELTEHYKIVALPAYVLYAVPGAEPHIQSPATPAQVTASVVKCCAPILQLHADF
jgi:thiol:disulfide interchange protein